MQLISIHAGHILGLLLATVTAGAAPTQPKPLLHEVFQYHAVLQRDRPLVLWGDSSPNDQVTVSLHGSVARAQVNASGHWQVTLPPQPAGGPYSLEVRTSSGAAQTLTDILVGDVYLCSGQSNMEFPMASVLNSAREIGAASNDAIRLMTVPHASNPVALAHFQAPVIWAAVSPATVHDFSAACYFFARDLQKFQHVPLGLIHSSWSGSRIEPWVSAPGISQLGGFDDQIELLNLYARDTQAANRRMGALWENWWQAHAPAGSTPWKSAVEGDWREAPAPLRNWKTWGIPELTNHNGLMWYRRSFTLTAEQAAGPATLTLGAINQVDETWVNERPIGNTFGYGSERTYQLPAGALRAGENSIVVNVLTSWDSGGLLGPEDRMALSLANQSQLSLAGQWRYQLVPESMGSSPRAPWESVAGLTSIYNAMIAPLGSYGLRGVLWYQGESNAGEADHYQALLSEMMRDWRTRFGAQASFLIVELPNFGVIPAAPTESNWASLREAQRRAVDADPHAALAVTIDLGDAYDLHPPNKQGVGARLAQAARHLIYGEAVSASGPVPHAARPDHGQIEVSFDGVDGGLVTYSARRPIGFELCDAMAACRFVDAELQGNRVLLDSTGMNAARRVRFCWGDAPICNLYDKSGLPAGPFDIEIAR